MPKKKPKKKKKLGKNKGKKYDKPLSLHPLSLDEAARILLKPRRGKKD